MRKAVVGLAAFGLVAVAIAATMGDDAPTATAARAIQPDPNRAEAYGLPGSMNSTTWTLASSAFTLSGMDGSFVLPLTVPERAISTLVEVTFTSGAAHTFAFWGLSTCAHRFDGPVVGDGTRVVFDCSGATPGAQEVQFTHRIGHLSGHIVVTSEVCGTYSRCPTVPPP